MPCADPAPARLGALRLRVLMARRGARRALAAAAMVLAVATALHHAMPAHAAMPGMDGMQHDHAAPAMAMCLGVVEGAFLLAVVGGVVRLRRPRVRRPLRARRPAVRPATRAGRPPCRDGPPPFLRLQVLRT